MKKHFANDGEEIDEPGPVMLAQTLRERLGLDKAAPVIAGPLSAEHRTILEEPERLSADEFYFSVRSGGGFKEAYQRAAAASPSSATFHKTLNAVALSKRRPFTKVIESKREVWGVVTEEKPDQDHEVCDFERSKPFYQAWIESFNKSTDGVSFGNLREMHQLSAVGRCVGFEFRDTDKQIVMGFKVVDDNAWKKVVERVYTGFSHGGEVVDKFADPDYPGCMRYIAKPVEISLVDNPCLQSATYTLIRADGKQEVVKIAIAA
jgi:hypothetical protein